MRKMYCRNLFGRQFGGIPKVTYDKKLGQYRQLGSASRQRSCVGPPLVKTQRHKLKLGEDRDVSIGRSVLPDGACRVAGPIDFMGPHVTCGLVPESDDQIVANGMPHDTIGRHNTTTKRSNVKL